MLAVILLSVILSKVIRLTVTRLNVVAPFFKTHVLLCPREFVLFVTLTNAFLSIQSLCLAFLLMSLKMASRLLVEKHLTNSLFAD
jgi:hypothetical protein